MARARVRAVIIGAGLMGRWHARASRQAGGVVVSVADARIDRARRLARACGARAVRTLAEALADGGADVAHVCTPTDSHERIAREAIVGGLHLIVEKPLAPTAVVTEALLDEAARRGVMVCPVHQFVYQSGVRRTVASLPHIGPVLHVQFTACSAGADVTGGSPREIANDILPHPLSLAAEILPVSLADVRWDVRRPTPGEILATGTAANVTVSILISMAGRPTTNMLRVIGAHGTAHLDLFHGFAVIESGSVSRMRKISRPFSTAGATMSHALVNLLDRAARGETAYPGLRALVRAFYGATRGDASPPVTPERILDIARARDAVLGVGGAE